MHELVSIISHVCGSHFIGHPDISPDTKVKMISNYQNDWLMPGTDPGFSNRERKTDFVHPAHIPNAKSLTAGVQGPWKLYRYRCAFILYLSLYFESFRYKTG